MSKQIQSAVRNANKLAAALARKEERQRKSTLRMNHRLTVAEDALSRAEASLLKAQERVAKCKAKLEAVREEKSKLGERQMSEVDAAALRARKATERAESLKAATPKSKPTASGGMVETESGEVRTISKAAAAVISGLVGRKRSGCFKPLDGADAQFILDAVDGGNNVGDTFEVRIKGRTTAIVFSVEAEGLAFQVGALVGV